MKTIKLFALLALILASGCGKDPKIDKVYDTITLDAGASRFTGTLIQGEKVTGATITLAYTNGQGQNALLLLPNENGLYSDPVPVTLAPGAGNVTLNVAGTPTVSGNIKLRPTLRVGKYEVFISIPASVTPAIALDGPGSTVSGTFHLGKPIANGLIKLKYTSFASQEVTISANQTAGMSVTKFTATLPAAPSGGTVDIPVTGTPTNHGTLAMPIIVTHGSDSYTTNVSITVSGDISFNVAASAVDRKLVKGKVIEGINLILNYNAPAELNATLAVENNNGISGAQFAATLPAGDGMTVLIPLNGTPITDGPMELKAVVLIGSTAYTVNVPVTVQSDHGDPFIKETFDFKGLTYNTIFVDINNNGYVDPGEVWLDRNIGATSADPGTYGAEGANAAAMGQMLQYGKPYGETQFDPNYTIDFEKIGQWDICPEGYRVPTKDEFNAAIAKETGGKVVGDGVVGDPGITLLLMKSDMKLPLSGWKTNGNQEFFGQMAGYWTSSMGNNTAPWKININDDKANSTGAGWAGSEWQVPVRCLKIIIPNPPTVNTVK